MGNSLSNITLALQVLKGVTARLLFGWSTVAYTGDSNPESSTKSSSDDTSNRKSIPSFLRIDVDLELATTLRKEVFNERNLNKLSNEQLIKICRQLEFWYSESGGNLKNKPNVEMVQLATSLVDQSLWYRAENNDDDGDGDASTIIKVPKVRFGKTELQMPVVTCGGMRFQSTWMPDFIPILRPNRKSVLSNATQGNIKNCLRACLALGINHFETARVYGTSEYQMVDALYELMEEGEIKREDFIFQTKIPKCSTTDKFKKFFQQSWDNVGEKLGYIDLLSLHAIKDMDSDVEESLAVCEELKKEGKIRHIGFSTHATAEQIMKLIDTERFEYVNLHYHFFGSYHASGTIDTKGGQGNLAVVQRALELDMGVFQISPFDKGGKLYRPSKDCTLTVGKELTPMEFAALFAWKKTGIHTSSLGIARPSDLDEVMSAARTMALGKKNNVDIDTLLDGSIDRLNNRFEEKVGKEWAEKGLLNLPTCYEESTQGVAIGHILWLHDMLVSFGMYEFCRDRYESLENVKWNEKKTFEENINAMSDGNPGRAFDESVDLSKALENHYDPKLVMKKLRETHKWLSAKEGPPSGYSDEDLTDLGFAKGYNLTTWEEMPGALDSTALNTVLLQVFTGGRMGPTTGPGYSFYKESDELRSCF